MDGEPTAVSRLREMIDAEDKKRRLSSLSGRSGTSASSLSSLNSSPAPTHPIPSKLKTKLSTGALNEIARELSSAGPVIPFSAWEATAASVLKTKRIEAVLVWEVFRMIRIETGASPLPLLAEAIAANASLANLEGRALRVFKSRLEAGGMESPAPDGFDCYEKAVWPRETVRALEGAPASEFLAWLWCLSLPSSKRSKLNWKSDLYEAPSMASPPSSPSALVPLDAERDRFGSDASAYSASSPITQLLYRERDEELAAFHSALGAGLTGLVLFLADTAGAGRPAGAVSTQLLTALDFLLECGPSSTLRFSSLGTALASMVGQPLTALGSRLAGALVVNPGLSPPWSEHYQSLYGAAGGGLAVDDASGSPESESGISSALSSLSLSLSELPSGALTPVELPLILDGLSSKTLVYSEADLGSVRGPGANRGAVRVRVTAVRKSYVYMLFPAASIALFDCSDTTFVLGPASGSLSLTGLKNCTVIGLAGSVTASNCSSCSLYLCAGSPPLLQMGSSGLALAPYNSCYPALETHLAVAGLNPFVNYWNRPLFRPPFFPSASIGPAPEAGSRPPSPSSSGPPELVLPSGDGEPLAGIASRLSPADFRTFTVPVVTDGSTVVNPVPLPPTYSAALADAAASLKDLQASIADVPSGELRGSLEAVLHSQFYEWLVKSGNHKQLKDLMSLQDAKSSSSQTRQ